MDEYVVSVEATRSIWQMIFKVGFWQGLLFHALLFLGLYIFVRRMLRKKWDISNKLMLHVLTMLLITPVATVIAIVSLSFFIALGKVSCKEVWNEYVNKGFRVVSVYTLDDGKIDFGTIVLEHQGWQQALKELYWIIKHDSSFISWYGPSGLPLVAGKNIEGNRFISFAHMGCYISRNLDLLVRCRGGCAVIVDSASIGEIRFYRILLVDKTCWGCVWGYALPRYVHEVDYDGIDSLVEFKIYVYRTLRMDKISLFGIHCDPTMSANKDADATFFMD